MYRYRIIFVFLFFNGLLFGQGNGSTILKNEDCGYSITKNVLILEDKEHAFTLEDILRKPDSDFYQTQLDNPIVQFTSSQFWIRFSITNQTDYTDFIVETARPITNNVNFHEIENGIVYHTEMNGDNNDYVVKTIPHRKNIFPLTMEKNQTKNFLIEIGSGGEGTMLPVIVHEKMTFFKNDFNIQFKNGFYYGMVTLVIVIFFFFFLLLKDITFLYYILYVFFQGLLQFSLDGYSFHHFFPSGGYWINRFPPLMGTFAIIFMLIYVNKFLNLKTALPRFRKAFSVAGILIAICMLLTFSTGSLHIISYPIVNAISLISIVLAVSSILYLHFTGKKVDIYFTIAFLILITGAIIFILGNFNIIENSTLSLNALKVSSVIEVVVLSISMSFKYRELQQDKEEAQARALKSLEEKNALMDQSNTLLEKQVKERTSEIERQKERLAKSNEEIVSSIKYAKRIQEAILPSDEQVSEILPNSFIFYRPKDVVSGDFYFVESPIPSTSKKEKFTLFAAVDCTGHGVPGAFMSIVGNNLLTQSIKEININSPSETLAFLNEELSKTLRHKVEGITVRDGMDMALCELNHDRTRLRFSGAKNPLYIIRSKQGLKTDELLDSLHVITESENAVILQIKGDKHPIGDSSGEQLKPFTNHEIDLIEGDQIFVFTDGFADQFGGERGKKYNYKRFREFLLSIYDKSTEEQNILLSIEFDRWKGNVEQIDDVLIIGVKVN